MARRFHKHWRFELDLPNHEIAIRSARVWFDAQTALVTAKPMLFGPDPELDDFIRKYRATSLTNETVRKRFNSQFPSAIVTSANRQVTAAPYSIVGQIPKLIRSGDLRTASMINSAAIDGLRGGDASLRAVVRDEQGVTTDLLLRNERFIESLQQQEPDSETDPDSAEPADSGDSEHRNDEPSAPESQSTPG